MVVVVGGYSTSAQAWRGPTTCSTGGLCSVVLTTQAPSTYIRVDLVGLLSTCLRLGTQQSFALSSRWLGTFATVPSTYRPSPAVPLENRDAAARLRLLIKYMAASKKPLCSVAHCFALSGSLQPTVTGQGGSRCPGYIVFNPEWWAKHPHIGSYRQVDTCSTALAIQRISREYK